MQSIFSCLLCASQPRLFLRKCDLNLVRRADLEPIQIVLGHSCLWLCVIFNERDACLARYHAHLAEARILLEKGSEHGIRGAIR